MPFILAIDQGTTSSRAILFDQDLKVLGQAQQEFEQHFPRSGWVEHAAEDLWETVLAVARKAIADQASERGISAAQMAAGIAAIGITNQRETTLIWDRKTGAAIYPAIVWQDRRTAAHCEELREAGHEAMISARTGLLLDPYFSATKVKWILDHVEGARVRAEAGELAFGTVDSWLIWRLTGGKAHLTDATNAARTMLYDIAKGEWDPEICALFGVPMSLLPEVKDCAADFGTSLPDLFGAAIPIRGVAGDQQAATVGQACFEPGMVKSTYGTGCFALLNTGKDLVPSKHRLLSTSAYQLDGKPCYALEGSIFIAGAVVQWLRDGLHLITSAAQTQDLAKVADETQDLVMVPAFTGLGAPYWRPDCRGAVFGLTRNSGPAEFARAALESVGYQTRDLLEAMHADWQAAEGSVLRVDGGMAQSDWAMQFLSDILGAAVDRPQVTETTAIGAAYLAGLGAGISPPPEEFAALWAREHRFKPAMDAGLRDRKYARWKRAIKATISV